MGGKPVCRGLHVQVVGLKKEYFLQMKNERKDALFGWNKTRYLTFEEFTGYKK